MQPSSLIFVAIIAIWAAFLVQHWVRRREALATARSVDRFSEAIRLLERRPVLPSPEPRPAPQVYAALASPLVARSTGARSAFPSSEPAEPVPTGPTRVVRRPIPPAHPRWGRLGRRVRAVAFLGLLVFVPVAAVLSAVGVLRWTSVVVAVICVALGVVMLRYAAVHERTLARVERAMASSQRVGDMHVRPVAGQRTADAASHASTRTPDPATVADQSSAEPAAVPVAAVPVAAGPGAVGERASRRAAYAAYSGDGTWQPVAVPPPTYTLKARAEHPQPQPAEVTPTPDPAPREPAEAQAPARAVGD